MIEDFKRNLRASFAGVPASDVPERPRDHEHDCRDDSEDNYYRRFKTMCVNAPITPQTSKAELEGRKPLQRLAEKAPPVAGKRRGGTLVPFLLDHACHPCERGGADRRRPCGPALRSGAGRPPISRLHYNSGNLQGAVLSRVMFPKAPCDRPTFAATRNYWVPPRTSRRACVLRQRARAWRMRRLGRNSSALRCVVAFRRPDVTRRNHTQACERRAREALVRAGAGFHDDRCTGEAGAAGR